MELGKRIRTILKFKGISQKDLAIGIGVNECLVSRWCNGLAKPKIENVEKLANFLTCSIIELLGYSRLFNELLEQVERRLV